MRGWRIKFIFLLIVYFVGFASAVYCLAPVPENQPGQTGESTFAASVFKSDGFAHSFNVQMHKCLEVAKDATKHASRFIKQKLEEKQLKTDR